MFKFLKQTPKTSAEEKLEKISQILFPKSELNTDKDGNKFYIDYSADSNLDAALNDLEEGYNDDTARNTIRKVSNRIFQIRKLLEAQQSLEKDIKYILVEDVETNKVEEILIGETSDIDNHKSR